VDSASEISNGEVIHDLSEYKPVHENLSGDIASDLSIRDRAFGSLTSKLPNGLRLRRFATARSVCRRDNAFSEGPERGAVVI